MEITKTPNGKYLLHLDEPVGLGAPRKSKNGNPTYFGGGWFTYKIGKKEHLLKINVNVIDCGVKKQK